MSSDDLLTGGHRDAGPHDVDLDRVWLGVAAEVWRRRPGPVERAAGRLLRAALPHRKPARQGDGR